MSIILAVPRCREMPGELEKIRVWFRDYKAPSRHPRFPSGSTATFMSQPCGDTEYCMFQMTLNSICLPLPQTPDGKPQNSYGYNDECLNKEFTLGVIQETHGFWNKLRSGERENTEELALQ
jgi:hypothetical protein